MQRDDTAAAWTRPFLLFFKQILIYAKRLDAKTIFDQADPIPLPIAFIETFDHRTGKGWAFKTKTHTPAFYTGFDPASPAMVGLTVLGPAASLTGFLFPEIHITNCAIYSTGSQDAFRDVGIKSHGRTSSSLLLFCFQHSFILFAIFQVWLFCDERLRFCQNRAVFFLLVQRIHRLDHIQTQ